MHQKSDLPTIIVKDLGVIVDPSQFVGRAPKQVDSFVKDVVGPIRKKYANQLDQATELKV